MKAVSAQVVGSCAYDEPPKMMQQMLGIIPYNVFEFCTSAGVNVLQLKSSMGFLIFIKGRGVEQSPDCFEANLSIKSNLLLDKQTYCKENVRDTILTRSKCHVLHWRNHEGLQ